MSKRWLNLFLSYSGYVFGLRQKVVKTGQWYKVLPLAVELLAIEVVFAVVSLPMYLLVPPDRLQEQGMIFPSRQKVAKPLRVYTVRRRISLATASGAGGLFVLKILVVGVLSFIFLGAIQILADTQDWTFSTPGDYVYNPAKIEVTGGVARLKNLGGLVSGSTVNSGFNTDASGWTAVPGWDNAPGKTNTAAWQSSGGNSGGYVDIYLDGKKNNDSAGYWYQSFTTTVNSPDTAVLSLDWKAVSVTGAPVSYVLYAFIGTDSGNPTIGGANQVWSSGNISGATSFATTTPIDIKSKVTAAGTYYLKIAAYVNCQASVDCKATAGFDNVIVNWSKTTVSYASDKPTTTPVSSLTMTKAISWNSFAETATKNGGEIYYQLSADNGSNWQYWNGSAWATTTLATNYNTATDVNSNISKFTTSTNQIKWRAYLSSDGTQQVILDNITITYTQNQRPQVQSLAPAQNTAYGYVHVNYNLQDAEGDLSSLTAYEYSLSGTFADAVTMTASTTDPAHSGVSGLSASSGGTPHVFVWDARSQLGNIATTTYVRLRPNDGIGNGIYTTSSVFTVDYVSSTVSNISVSQPLATTTVTIAYDLFDNTADNILVEMQISGDDGSTWTVPSTSVSGAVGAGVAAGNSKVIYWNAGADYPNQQKNNLQVRIRAKDKWQNQGAYVSSANFSLDTLPAAILSVADLKAQPNAGDTAVLIGGSFTEVNPDTNHFYVAINSGSYSSSTAGDSDTATPSNQSTAVGTTLDGNDYISKVKIIHTDDYSNVGTNENLTPDAAYKYVKPYTPSAPTLSNPVTTRLDLTINPHVGEASDVPYALFETTTSKYVQSDGTLGVNPVWQIIGTGSGQWGNNTGSAGMVRITGLSSPVANYIFKVKSRNPSDSGHAASSESSFSASAQITNTAPGIALSSYAQTTDGSQYSPIAYTGTDGQGDITYLSAYEYSVDGSTWHTMTEKSGVGSNGTTNLVFLPTGSAYSFVWDSGADLSNMETTTAKVRLRGNDTLTDGSLSTSANFVLDNKAPVVSAVVASQTAGDRTIAITYDLTDANNSLIQIDISSDGGTTWTVATSSLTGAVGSGVTSGTGKSVTWNAGTDYNNQYNTNIMVRIRARDTFGNQGSYSSSAIFTVDTHAPMLSNLSANQDSNANTFTFHYDVSEDAGNINTLLAISADGGSTWTVATSSASGDLGVAVAPGTSKTITWDAGADYNNQEKTNMQFRLVATDGFSNSSSLASSDFSLDTKAPRITNVSATQPLGETSVTVSYDLADQNNSLVMLDISNNSGATWTVATSTLSGEIGIGRTPGIGKIVTWNAAADFPNQNLSTMQVRVRALDVFANQSANVPSTDFSLDTLPPAVSVIANLSTQPLAGATTTLISGSFTEANPNINNFYVAINGGAYGSATIGSGNTASPADQATAVGATLDGNDYVSQVKVVHTDDYGQSVTNENNSPNSAYKYVKPYTPSAPTVNNPSVGTVDVLINKNPAEIDGLEYAIYESSQNKYVQSDGTLGISPVWQVIGTGFFQWGFYSGVSGKINISGLTLDSYYYQFQIKSRNSSDASHAASSDSTLSSGASSVNQSPTIVIDSVAQTTDGTKYVVINYTGFDLESETTTLVTYQYSTDNAIWHTMTEKSGVGSDGKIGLSFISVGTAHDFMWDVGVDFPNTEDETVYVRLQADDSTSSGGVTASSAFIVDTKNPITASVTASQDANSNNVSVSYNLTDLSDSYIEFDVSSDSGSTWTVATSTASGDVHDNVTPGSGKAISWNPGMDYSGQESGTMRVRVGARDNFGNSGSLVSSVNFAVDSKAPVFANISAAQVVSSSLVSISYDFSDANSSVVAMDISSDGGGSWDVASSSVSGAIGAGITTGNSKIIIWDAGADFPNQQVNNMQIRLRAVDAYANATGNVGSNLFAINTQAPVINTVTAEQVVGSDNVVITYNLFDSDNVVISVGISSDGGATWTVATTTLTGDVGYGVAPGLGKTINWNPGVDFNSQQNGSMKVRIRGTNTYGNSSAYAVLVDTFSVDTLAPTILTIADLTAQPLAGDTSATVSGSFTEANPTSNEFLVAFSSDVYSATTTGESNTATPADQAVPASGALTGHDYISKVKLVETDNYGHTRINENTSPTASYKYVKPYTPGAPTVNNPQNTTVDVTINSAFGEASDVPYVIYEVSTGQYVQSNGTLGVSAVWQTLGTGAGQWGQGSGISGQVTISGLFSPVANYSFKIKSRNPSDAAHLTTSESDFSTITGIANTAPAINISSATQQASGGYVLINYIGTDAQNDTNDLTVFEYSIDNANWQVMTEKSGVGSNGTSSLIFSSVGTAYIFAWDIATDLPNQENSTVYVRLKSSDTLADSNLAVSSAFYADTLGPVISNIDLTQTPGTGLAVIIYDLIDNSGASNTVSLLISNDGGLTYTVPVTTASGDVGNDVTAGVGRSISWNPQIDLANQENSAVKVKLQGADRYGNAGLISISDNFTVDTKGPVVSGVSAGQSAGTTDVVINYNLADITPAGNLVEFNISDDGGATWTVSTTTRSGQIGSGQTIGAKAFIWSAGTDFVGQDLSSMRVRVRAKDYFGNQGAYVASGNFALDTKAPVISGVSASQIAGTDSVAVSYDLGENADVAWDISSDGGLTWTVIKTTAVGDLGAVTAGNNKLVTWNTGVDFINQENSHMRVRFSGTDSFGNVSTYYESADFSVDTGAPLGLASLSKFSETATTITMNWQTATDANFNHYELWHGATESDVVNRTGTADKWSVIDDVNLSNSLTISTVITGLNITNNYYVKIWAIDDYGNEATVAQLNVFAPVTPPVVSPVIPPVVGGGAILVPDTIAPVKPLLNSLDSPTNSTRIAIGGLSEPGSNIDLFDNGVLFARLNNSADSGGRFSQIFNFSSGNHSLTVRATDRSGNISQLSDPVNLLIIGVAPAAPIILNPINNSAIAEATPTITGVTEPLGEVLIALDGRSRFTVTADLSGAWNFKLPSASALVDGRHTISVTVRDQAGNVSNPTVISINKVVALPASVTPIITVAGITPIQPVPTAQLVELNAQAVELAGIPVPQVTNIQTIAVGDTLSFSGTSLPNQDVIVYIHSDQALIYRTHTDSQGNWRIDHSQDITELSPGQHTIFAVALDSTAQIKSRPSPVSTFTVRRNFWVMIYRYLNWQTTVITLVILVATIFWLYRARKRQLIG
ncbi:MAG: Ig-like domain-containing protein [Patescibacteria group bacterium]